MAQGLLLSQDDVPVGFQTGATDPLAGDCPGFAELDEEYGEAAAAWLIEYVQPLAIDPQWISQVVVVWEDPSVAEERVLRSVLVARDCLPERLTTTFVERDIEGADVRGTSVFDTDLPFAGRPGLRFRTEFEHSGLTWQVYRDYVYIADTHAIVVLSQQRLVTPPDPEATVDLVRAVERRLAEFAREPGP